MFCHVTTVFLQNFQINNFFFVFFVFKTEKDMMIFYCFSMNCSGLKMLSSSARIWRSSSAEMSANFELTQI